MEKIEKPILDLIDVPNRDAKEGMPRFWQVLESLELKQALLFAMVNELRSFSIDGLSDPQCRSRLAKVQAFANMIDFADCVNGMINKTNQENQQTPFDAEEYEIESE